MYFDVNNIEYWVTDCPQSCESVKKELMKWLIVLAVRQKFKSDEKFHEPVSTETDHSNGGDED